MFIFWVVLYTSLYLLLTTGRVVEQDEKLIQNGSMGHVDKLDLLARRGGVRRREKEDIEKLSNSSEDVTPNIQIKDKTVRGLLNKDVPRPHSWAEDEFPQSEQRKGLNRRVSSSLSDLRQEVRDEENVIDIRVSQYDKEKSRLTVNGPLESVEKNNLAEIIDSVKREKQVVVKSPTSSVTSLTDVDVDLGEREEMPDVHVKSNLTSKSLSYGCLADLDRKYCNIFLNNGILLQYHHH